jgi:hypothetical protein
MNYSVISRGGKYSGPRDHWSQKIFYAGSKKKGREEKGERKKSRKRKERKIIERKRVTAPISSHFVHGQTLGEKNFDSGMWPHLQFLPPLLALYCTTALVPKFAIRIIPFLP